LLFRSQITSFGAGMQEPVTRFVYPDARREDEIREHGLPDPYRWLEDPDSDETRAWVNAQNETFQGFIQKSPDREKLKNCLTELYNYPKRGCPFKRGDYYYYYRNDGLQNQYVLYQQESLEAEARVFLDPNLLESDGTAALGVTSFAESGKYFAYGVKRSGSDWQTIHIKNALTGENLTDQIDWVKFSSIAWTHDDRGFFYARYPKPSSVGKEAAGSEIDVNLNHQVYYHRLGTSQDSDVLIYNTPDEPKWMFGVEVTTDGRYLILTISKSTAPINKLYYVDLTNFDPCREEDVFGFPVVKLIDNWDAQYEYVANDGTIFYLKTNLNAPRSKLISIDIEHPEEEKWKVLIPESEDVMSYLLCFDETRLIACYIHHVKDVLMLYNLADGRFERELPLPCPGTVTEISGRRKDKEIFFAYTSFLYPSSIFRFDYSQEGCGILFHETKVPGFDPSLFTTEQVFYRSKDGTQVPMFIVSRKSIPRDGSAAFYLYGYGGFSISIQPTFSVFRVVFMSHYDIGLAIPNIRGGGEYGEDWHNAGILEKKQNVFDDFCAAAEYLIENKYTSANRLAISGGSNGGLLVGACINQRPELFGCAISQVGVLDMLRFHKFTIGHAWTADYGCADNPEEFKFLIKYSPLHNVQADKIYPATLLTTGDHDDRVVPLHSYKFIATLQHLVGRKPEQTKPLMIRVEVKAGHGAGKPTAKVIEETADIYAFIALNLGLQWHD
jgi:prolyl oligopeptidase